MTYSWLYVWHLNDGYELEVYIFSCVLSCYLIEFFWFIHLVPTLLLAGICLLLLLSLPRVYRMVGASSTLKTSISNLVKYTKTRCSTVCVGLTESVLYGVIC